MVLMWPSRHVGLLSFIIKTCLHNWLVIGNWVIHSNLFFNHFVTVREGFVSNKVLYLSLWGLRNNLDHKIGHYWIYKIACIFKQTARLYWICGFFWRLHRVIFDWLLYFRIVIVYLFINETSNTHVYNLTEKLKIVDDIVVSDDTITCDRH